MEKEDNPDASTVSHKFTENEAPGATLIELSMMAGVDVSMSTETTTAADATMLAVNSDATPATILIMLFSFMVFIHLFEFDQVQLVGIRS